MKIASRILSVFLTLVVSMSIIEPVSASCSNVNTHTFIDIKTKEKFTNIKKCSKNISAVYTKPNFNDNEHFSKIKQLVENGIDVYVDCRASEELENNFGLDFRNTLFNTNGIMLGFVLMNNINGIKGTPVYACCMYAEGEQPTSYDIKNDCENIKENFSVSLSDIEKITKKEEMSVFYPGIEDSVRLQAININDLDFDNMFYDEECFYFAYGKKLNGDTLWSKTAVDGYTKLGYAKISMTCYEIGDKLSRNYDAALITSEVGSYGNYSVIEYTTRLATSGIAEKFTPQKPANTSNQTVSVSTGTGISSTGEFTNTLTYTTSYSPDGQTFTGSYLDETTYQIVSTPMSTQEGSDWTTISSMSVAVPENTLSIFLSMVSDMKIKYWRTYTLVDGEAGCSCLYKSHNLY